MSMMYELNAEDRMEDALKNGEIMPAHHPDAPRGALAVVTEHRVKGAGKPVSYEVAAILGWLKCGSGWHPLTARTPQPMCDVLFNDGTIHCFETGYDRREEVDEFSPVPSFMEMVAPDSFTSFELVCTTVPTHSGWSFEESVEALQAEIDALVEKQRVLLDRRIRYRKDAEAHLAAVTPEGRLVDYTPPTGRAEPADWPEAPKVAHLWPMRSVPIAAE
jgi:hypothetical protein